MQPFALFNLLKSALFPENSNATEQQPSIENSLPSSEQNTQKETALKSEPFKTEEETQEKPNACLDFLLRHEIRAGRQKKR